MARNAPAARPLTSAVGAVIEPVDLREPKPDTVAFIRRILVERGVVFFQKQEASVEQLWRSLSHFGMPQKEDSFGADHDRPSDVCEADFQPTKHGTAVWHTDSSFLERPPKFTLLRMVRQPPIGGDTCWASMVAAYESLSTPLRSMLDGLSAVHSIKLPMSRLGDYGEVFGKSFCAVHATEQIHPVVLLHPETGRKALYVNESCTARIVELSASEVVTCSICFSLTSSRPNSACGGDGHQTTSPCGTTESSNITRFPIMTASVSCIVLSSLEIGPTDRILPGHDATNASRRLR